MESGPTELEILARQLERSPDYRVLRRVAALPTRPVPDGVPTRQGLFVDVETTGLDPATDEIIELAMLPFTYGMDGAIYEVHPAFSRLRQPDRPIPPSTACSSRPSVTPSRPSPGAVPSPRSRGRRRGSRGASSVIC